MEYWKEEKTGAKASASVATLTSADKAAWQGRQNEKHWNIGIMECWKNGKEKKGKQGIWKRQGEQQEKKKEGGNKL